MLITPTEPDSPQLFTIFVEGLSQQETLFASFLCSVATCVCRHGSEGEVPDTP